MKRLVAAGCSGLALAASIAAAEELRFPAPEFRATYSSHGSDARTVAIELPAYVTSVVSATIIASGESQDGIIASLDSPQTRSLRGGVLFHVESDCAVGWSSSAWFEAGPFDHSEDFYWSPNPPFDGYPPSWDFEQDGSFTVTASGHAVILGGFDYVAESAVTTASGCELRLDVATGV